MTEIDLHMHTYYSDGRASPAELLQAAANRGLRVVAITDHDTTAGWREAQPEAERLGMELIAAVELTTRWDNLPGASRQEDVDLLGYLIRPQHPVFAALERAGLDDFRGRVSKLCAYLTEAGYPLGMDDLLKLNPRYPGLVQVIQVLQVKGLCASWREADAVMRRFWRRVGPPRLSIERAIAGIHVAGGVAVLAHPAAIATLDRWLGPVAVAQLVSMGLDGLEVYHHRLDEPARKHFLALAQQHRLLVTGGSDEHGWRDGFHRLGSQPVSMEMLAALRAAVERRSDGSKERQ